MDLKEEYHDPDYAGTSENVKEEPPSLSEDERIEKIKKIIRREFSNELEVRENEVMQIDQKMTISRRLLHKLRYALVSTYYREQRLQLSAEQARDEVAGARDQGDRSRTEMSSLLRQGQRRLHPSVRKLLGKRTADLSEIFKTRQPRSRPRPDYSAMLQIRNYTIAADSTKSLRPAAGSPAGEPVGEPAGEPAPRPPRPSKLPRHREPAVQSVLTLDEQSRNKVKHRYRIVIGNTSKYAPPASLADRSTHKWLLYVRDYAPRAAGGEGEGEGAGRGEGVGGFVKAVTARLHHSYAPHHTVTLHKPPFHISRRGWGEFTARLELHFALPALNPPATVGHTIKLDRNYTGLQTLGAETIVDVWLYSSPDMLKYAYTDDHAPPQPDPQPDTQPDLQPEPLPPPAAPLVPKQEPLASSGHNQDDSWLEFFSRNSAELDVDDMLIRTVKSEPVPEPGVETEPQIKEEPIEWEENLIRDIPTEILNQPTSPNKRIMKYMDPTTGKIYYLEVDRDLDLSTVHEIVINNTKAKISPLKNGVKNVKKKRQVSLLKPEVKNLIKTEQINQMNACFRHIENDHCYLGTNWSVKSEKVELSGSVGRETVVQSGESELASLRAALSRLPDVRTAVYYLLRHIPLVDGRAVDPDYQRCFPFVVDSEDRYWKLDFAKRRNIEWSRAKLITRLLAGRAGCWRTKQVLTFARLHGFHPVRPDPRPHTAQDDWSSWRDLDSKSESHIKELYKPSDINSLTLFNSEQFTSEVTQVDLVDSDEEIDVLGSASGGGRVRGVSEGSREGVPIPPADADRLPFVFVERVCADVGLELRNEDVGGGCMYSAVHAVLLSALRSLAEELLRSALADSRGGGAGGGAPLVWGGWSSSRGAVRLEHVYRAAGGPPPATGAPGDGGGATAGPSGTTAGPSGTTAGPSGTSSSGSGRLALLCAQALAAEKKNTYAV